MIILKYCDNRHQLFLISPIPTHELASYIVLRHVKAPFDTMTFNINRDAASPEYKELVKVHLARQVGSRYYITSYNAGRILCLSEAIKEFLAQEQQLKSLNKLEKEVQQKMEQTDILAQLQLDRLLFDHIYSDQGRIEPPKVARGHVTNVNGKIQNNVIYRTLLLLLATPDVREIHCRRRLHDVA